MSGGTARDTIYCSECKREPSEEEDALRDWRTQAANQKLYILCSECWADPAVRQGARNAA
jgi:hypothetical protein